MKTNITMKDLTTLIFLSICAVIGWNLGGMLSGKKEIQPRDYQIQIKGDTAILYDGNRKVSVFSYKSTELEQIILMDNQ